MLASVVDEREARLVASLGADIVDAKNPSAGALGALPAGTVAAIRAAVPRRVPVSATIGDPVDDVPATIAAARGMAAAGADIVKVGLSKATGGAAIAEALGGLDLGGARLVGVLLAEEGVDLDIVDAAGAAGFAGLMLDTGDKRRGALPDILSIESLRRFVVAMHTAGMFAGLAGSLRAEHVTQLLSLGPDVLGFRGGLCREGERTSEIDADAVRAIRRIIPVCDAASADACRLPLAGGMARQQEDVT
jgi:(5-formylfuran-3-yl)methyl phosphate synthase